ncbi:putative alcohol dehydrogenase [Pestalotiopsis sp. NC0098]|nr:putative alcohol dehydrogenase [Pestalotiopsis sp. NC0098]
MSTFAVGSNGLRLPAIGIGTFHPGPISPDAVRKAVLDALNAGYRMIDTAFLYGEGMVERAVGEAIREWDGSREDVVIISKLANAHHRPEDVGPAIDMSLQNLGVDYVDLYLMHWPVAYMKTGSRPSEWRTSRHADGRPKIDYGLTADYLPTWQAMEVAVSEGKVREIGVSNFSISKLQKLIQGARIKPAVNQVELHPYLPQSDLLEFCDSQGIHLQAHSPLGGRPVSQVALSSHISRPIEDEYIKAIAQAYNVTPAAVLLKWAIQRGTTVVPKSYDAAHIVDNLAAPSMADISVQEMSDILGLRATKGFVRFTDHRKYWGFNIHSEARENSLELAISK